ncbi:DUF4190 domain-containing protein [Gordonia sp. NPDC003424]
MYTSDHPTDPIRPVDTDRIRVWAPTGSPGRQPTRMVEDPIPEAGDFWELANVDPLPMTAYEAAPREYTARPVRSRASGASSAALAAGIAAVPLSIVGIGAVLGLVAIVLGVGGIRQVARTPVQYHGNGRAITGIVLGTCSVVVGTPILLLFAGLAALL